MLYILIMAIIPAMFNPPVRNEFGRNLLPYASTFNETQTWNVTGSGTAVNDATHALNGKALRVNSIADTTVSFSLTDQLNFTAPATGMYVFSVEIYKTVLLGDDANVILEFYRDGINPYQLQCDLSGDGRSNNQWQYFAQSMQLNAGEVVSFKGNFTSGFADSTVWIDNLKVEFDPNATGLPTPYLEPEPLGKNYNITFGSVTSGSTTTMTINNVPDAQDGNIVLYGVKNAVMILGGLWGKAWVSAPGTVKIPYTNNTGSTIVLNAADYPIKIVK